jgi:hypothetical protein
MTGVQRSLPPNDARDSAADERERAADEREAQADEREAALDDREEVRAAREEQTQDLLAEAEVRDDRADDRDSIADQRDSTASLHSFLNDTRFEESHKARRSAAIDRLDAKTDRAASASDRSKLTEEEE